MRTSPPSRPGRSSSSRRDLQGSVEISLDKLRERATANKPSTWDLFVASFARALEEISTLTPERLGQCHQPPKVEGPFLPAPAPPKWISLEDASAVARQTAQELEDKTKQLEVGACWILLLQDSSAWRKILLPGAALTLHPSCPLGASS